MSNVTIASTINEIEKLSNRKKALMLPILVVLLTGGAAWLFSNLKIGAGILPISGGQLPILLLGWFTGFILPLFIIMAGADLFSGEMAERTIKISLLRPINRLKLYASKLLAIGAYVVGTLLLLMVLSVVVGGILGFGIDVIETLKAYSMAILPMTLVIFIVGLLAQFFRSGSGVMAFGILLFIGSQAVAALVPGLSDFMLPTYLDWHMLFTGAGADGGRVLTLFMYMVSYSIIALTGGYFLFDRKEI